MHKLYNENTNIDYINESIFFGKSGRNVQRYDEPKYPDFYKLGEKMDSQFWKPSEISLSKDVIDYKKLSPSERHIFDSNLMRQSVLDSIQGRSLLATFGRVCTSPELEFALTRVQFQETNHSDTYTYIIRAVKDNPREILDSILKTKIITKHTTSIKMYYERFYNLLAKWEALPEIQNEATFKELKKALYLALISWNVLEGVRFYVSFACTFAFAENKLMEGNAKELKLIARDENIHLALTQRLINILNKEESEGFVEIAKECEEEAIKIFRDTMQDEIEWVKYLFKDGSIIGLNEEILTDYMKELTSKRMKAIKLPKIVDNYQHGTLPWMKMWLGEERVEERPQETQIASYAIGILKDDGAWEESEDNKMFNCDGFVYRYQ